MSARISWDRYFVNITRDVGERSTCDRRHIGAVITNVSHEIVATGYNGNPRGMSHCATIGCIRNELNIPSGTRTEICTAVHAEQNALLQAGRASFGGTLYCAVQPCNVCAKMIINAGIRRVVYLDPYPETMGVDLMVALGLEVERYYLEEDRVERITTFQQSLGAEDSLQRAKEAAAGVGGKPLRIYDSLANLGTAPQVRREGNQGGS